MDTQADSRPAAAGRVPSTGSTTRKARWPAVGHQAPIFRVEADIAFGGQRLLDDPLGNLVDRQGGVAAGRACDVFASVCGSQLRNDRVPHAGRDLEGQAIRVGHRVTALRSMAAS